MSSHTQIVNMHAKPWWSVWENMALCPAIAIQSRTVKASEPLMPSKTRRNRRPPTLLSETKLKNLLIFCTSPTCSVHSAHPLHRADTLKTVHLSLPSSSNSTQWNSGMWFGRLTSLATPQSGARRLWLINQLTVA